LSLFASAGEVTGNTPKQGAAKQEKYAPQAHKIIARTGKTREEVKSDPKKGK
jgi:hypothetical protein